MKRYFYYLAYLLLVWGSFRYFVRLPEVIEELWFKPVVWLLPVFLLNSLHNRVKFFEKSNVMSLLVGVLMALFYIVILGFGRGSGGLDADWLGVIIAVSIVEELTFSGYWAKYIKGLTNINTAVVLTGLGVVLVRMPIWFGVYRLGYAEMLGAGVFAFGFGVAHAWLRLKTNSVLGSVVARIGLMLTFG